nr:MAG TPA: hypothetical protein [Caudoviricetes sp.]
MADSEVTLNSQVSALATRIGTECKTLHGETTKNASAVSALQTKVGNLETITNKSEIDDTQVATNKTYSSSKISSEITAAKQAVKDDLLNGAGAAYDTLKELGDAIDANKSAIDALKEVAAGHVKYDAAQSLTNEQQKQGRDNIGAASATALTTLEGKVTTNTTGVAEAKTAATTADGKAVKAQGDVDALKKSVGNTSTDFVALFEAALNAA